MHNDTQHARRHELGAFLRAHRERITPAMLGLPPGRRRRTPGLRREEVAQLCDISVTWYTWAEQGRDVSLSVAALDRLASTLRLGPGERRYLYELSGRRDPHAGEDDGTGPHALPAQAMVATIDAPAYVLDRYWTAVAWNAAAAALFVGWLDADTDKRNLLRFLFLQPSARTLIPDWDDRARRVVAEFRIDYSRHLDDPGMQALADDLIAGSAAFAQAWEAHAVVRREGGERRFAHPQWGDLRYRQFTLQPSGHPDDKLVMLLPD